MTDYEYAEKQTALFVNIPFEFQSSIAYLAYEEGHAYGNQEIYIHLVNLISAFEEPIKKFEKRVRKEARREVEKENW